MKRTVCTILCFAVVFCGFPIASFANDFTDEAVEAFQAYRKTNDEVRTAFLSGDTASLREKGDLLEAHKENFTKILKSLPEEYCADPQPDLLKEFIQILTGITDEYPTYVLAELYACDSDRVIEEIQSLTPEQQIKMVDDLDWGFKIMAYKIESLPNYKELTKELNNLKSATRKWD
jgi:hypothetical protein